VPNIDHVEQLIRLFFAGVGMTLIAVVNLLMRRARIGWRVAASAAVGGLVLTGYAAWQSKWAAIGQVATLIAVSLVPVVALGSRHLIDFGTAALRVSQKPAARWGLLAAGGFAVVLGAVVDYSIKDDRAISQELADLEAILSQPELAVIDRVPAKTDRGYEVVMRRPAVMRDSATISDPEGRALKQLGYDQALIRRAPATDFSNCHGWVFTGGRYWVGNDAVQKILDDNGYTATPTPKAGDIVIYRNLNGISHTGIVRYTGDGSTMIESKWSWMGVFLHPVDKSVYGHEYTYYQSTRNGHVLAGVDHPDGGAVAAGPGN
jgi:hypothetical protein